MTTMLDRARSALILARSYMSDAVDYGTPCARKDAAVVDEALADLDHARADNGWLPIESAPKDGTTVVLLIRHSGIPMIGSFSHGKWWADTEHYDVSCGAFCYGGSVTTQPDTVPTRWQPLPAPPIATESTSQEVGNG